MVEKEEFKTKINTAVDHIKNNDITSATTELLKLIDDYNQGYDELENEKTNNQTLTETNKDLNSKITSLKDVNMDLLLKVGTKTDNPASNIKTNLPGDDNPTPRKFEDLFNEKGELK